MTTANASIPEPPRRSVIAILSDCEEQVRMLVNTARLLDHLQASEISIHGGEMLPIQSVLEGAAGALKDLHKEALAAIGGGTP